MLSEIRFMLLRASALFILLALPAVVLADTPESGEAADAKISYYQQIRPILQAHCHGCHQPAKANGQFVMTAFEPLVAGGESGSAAVVPGKPDESYLIEQITPEDGEALMPPDKPPLADAQVALIRRWIEQGAADDSPVHVRQRYDMDHPPVYVSPPVITSLDYSPDGTLLAIAGFHEVLLTSVDGGETVARLVGLAERIESVRFSPDGALLAVAGGLPGRMGELQVWDVAKRRLKLSLPVTFDTIYGGNWSPDGKQIAVGGGDNSVRAIEVESGREVVYMAAHDDWVRGTVFSADGKSIFSAGRDMTVKMTDVATQRFVGNVTTHTPGVLRGGQLAIRRHPVRSELLVGGADGAPKLFQMDVKAAPASGGNPNQIREYEALPGRVFDVGFHPDGSRIYAGSSLDGAGRVRCFETDSGKRLWDVPVAEASIYALACSPDGTTLAAAGSDGQIRLLDAASGQLKSTFMPFEIQAADASGDAWTVPSAAEPQSAEPSSQPSLPPLAAIAVEPAAIQIGKPTDYVQILVFGDTPDGQRWDVTRLAQYRVAGDVGQVTGDGRFLPAADGSGQVVVSVGDRSVEIPVHVQGMTAGYTPDFIRDVNPILSRLGCNQGTCHGAAAGRNGFKLSLRGYDALFDIRSFTDDLASRRINLSSPDDSLMLLKATGAVPHQGGALMRPGDSYYQVLRNWIANGARLDLSTERVAKIDVLPHNPVADRPGSTQQMRVIATYADGSTRDVTREAFVETGNGEVAAADRTGLMTAIRRGEAAVLARYEGAYAATTLTVMGDRTGFVWQEPETWGTIDELVAAKWQRMKILPSPLCTDDEFIRRVQLDLTGLPPTADAVRQFLADPRDTRTKRDELVDQLIGSEDFIEYWTNKWADLLQVNRKFLGPEGAAEFRKWIRAQLATSQPYDQFVREILTASGSNRENPAASYYKILRDPLDTMENTTHLFLGVRFNCNKCHDHPFERWTQDQYFQTAAFFARLELKPDPAAGDKKIGGTAVEGAKPLYEIVSDRAAGEVVHDRTQAVTPPEFPFDCEYESPENASRRQQIAAWITAPDNPYFARSYVNRLWGYLLGVGLIEPLDDIRAGNPPSNPELLDYLTAQFVDSGFNMRHVLRLICQSRTYQLAIQTNPWNADDATNYSRALARRLPAEVLYDSIYRVTGAASRIPGVPAGTRAAALPDSGLGLADGFLANLGRPVRESACECERSSELQLGPVMALISGPTVDTAITDPNSELTKLTASEMVDARLVDELFLRILNRPATEQEIAAGLNSLQQLPMEHQALAKRLEDYEGELAPQIAERESQRQARIAAATDQLRSYEAEIAPREAELEKQQQQRIAQADAALKAYDQELPQRQAQWEQQIKQPTVWTVLDPIELKASNNAKLERQDDSSVFVSGPNGKGQYTFAARTDLERHHRDQAGSADRRSPAEQRAGTRPERQFRAQRIQSRVGAGGRTGQEDGRRAAKRPSRLQPGQLQRLDRHRRPSRPDQQRLGHQSESRREPHGRVRNQGEHRRRTGAADRHLGSAVPGRPARDRPLPHLRHHRPAACQLGRPAAKHRRHPGHRRGPAQPGTAGGSDQILPQLGRRTQDARAGAGRSPQAAPGRSETRTVASAFDRSQPAAARRSQAGRTADGGGSEHKATAKRPLDLCPRPGLGPDQQPGLFVQPITRLSKDISHARNSWTTWP
jgi:mono/diheme cytochrome c family protein